jgi:hypothetical protein
MHKEVFKFFIIVLVACCSCNNQQKKTEVNTENVVNKVSKINVVALLKTKKDNSNLNYNDINNIDKINGFRQVHLDLSLDSIDCSGLYIDSTLVKYDIIELVDNYDVFMEDIKIGGHRIYTFHLWFLKNKLKKIKIEYGRSGADALSMLVNIYGKPSNYYLLEDKIEESVKIANKDRVTDRNSFLYQPPKNKENTILVNTPYTWKTKNIEITYELESRFSRNPNSPYGKGENHFNNILIISEIEFQAHYDEIQKELMNKKKEEQKLKHQSVKKEHLNEF